MGFKDEIKSLSQTVIAMQENEEREYITDDEAIAAINVLNFAKYNKVPDIFLGCAAYNLLNVYVKQKTSGLSCSFHRFIREIIKGIEDVNQPKTIRLAFDTSENLNLLIINFWDFQFSFQSMRLTDQIKNLLSNRLLTWDGIRKQKCAGTIFRFALDNSWISNTTLGGEDLRAFIEREISIYYEDGYSVKDGRFVKVKELQPAKDELDEHLKNYIRSKLYSCQDRPVIISGIFRKAWEKHVTFTSVKPFIPNTRVITICDHINLFRKDVERSIDINSLQFGERYYIIGYCRPYKRVDRMGVQLAVEEGFCPIFRMKDYSMMPVDIKSRCHRFSIEEYLSIKQQELKL
ncbi:hypothetical protein [Eubacterium sp. AB3007]|uniref:hypothetical protein n=1 Tax=Eubacterium sp. AB3007 TaxID=1392487 RepID=UPI00048750C3|nr:hypothetical protein [Eubacterium sp. AB3007]